MWDWGWEKENGWDLNAKRVLSVNFLWLGEPWKVLEQGCDLTRGELLRDHSSVVMEWKGVPGGQRGQLEATGRVHPRGQWE